MLHRNKILTEIARRTELIETILLVRDPGATQAAQAYDGLRRAIIDARQTRQQHLVHLAQIDSALQRGQSGADIQLLLRDLLAQASVERTDDPTKTDCYEIDGSGDSITVIEAAYIDGITRAVIRQGRAQASKPGSAELKSREIPDPTPEDQVSA